MQSPLMADKKSVDGDDDGREVHLVYSEYDCAPSETDVEVIESGKQYWWKSSTGDELNSYYNHAPHGTNDYCSLQSGREVCLVYSDYDEPSSEISVEMNQFFNDKKIEGREVCLTYSEYDEPPSETDVEYDGRPWCSIFGNPALWKVRDEGREMHLIYSDYTEPKSEVVVEMESDSEPDIAKLNDLETPDDEISTGQEMSYDDISEISTHNTISSDIYTRGPPEFRPVYIKDSLEFLEQRNEMISDNLVPFMSTDNDSISVKKTVKPVQHLDNMEQLLAFVGNRVSEDSVSEYFDDSKLSTEMIAVAKSDLSMVSGISADCDTALGNSFAMDQNVHSDIGDNTILLSDTVESI